MKQEKNIFEYFVNLVNLGIDVYEASINNTLDTYLYKNKDVIFSRIILSKFDGDRFAMKNFLKSPYIKKNYPDFHTFVKQYYGDSNE